MRRRRNKEKKNLRALRLWSFEEATRAVPYLRSVLGSLREHWLEAQRQRRQAELLEAKPGRPDRTRILSSTELRRRQETAESSFDEALDELLGIDVYLVDPVRGAALIPFRKEDDLAWYVFDHFDKRGVSGWRYHNDPLEECRPLEESPEAKQGSA